MVQSDESDAEPNIESLYEQDFAALRAECLRAGRLFEDPEFLPQEVICCTLACLLTQSAVRGNRGCLLFLSI